MCYSKHCIHGTSNIFSATVTLSTSAAIGYNVFTVEATDTENDQITLGITCIPVTPTCPFQLFACKLIFRFCL